MAKAWVGVTIIIFEEDDDDGGDGDDDFLDDSVLDAINGIRYANDLPVPVGEAKMTFGRAVIVVDDDDDDDDVRRLIGTKAAD